MIDDKKRKLYRITGQCVLDFMRKFGDVPDDAEFIDVHYQPHNETILIKCKSDEHEIVHESSDMKVEDVEFRQRLEEISEQNFLLP